jgi:TatA/E family protein of Tat protein translocase
VLKNLSTAEVVIIALVLMVFFGSKKIPEFTKTLAESGKEFRKGLKGEVKSKKKTDITVKDEKSD